MPPVQLLLQANKSGWFNLMQPNSHWLAQHRWNMTLNLTSNDTQTCRHDSQHDFSQLFIVWFYGVLWFVYEKTAYVSSTQSFWLTCLASKITIISIIIVLRSTPCHTHTFCTMLIFSYSHLYVITWIMYISIAKNIFFINTMFVFSVYICTYIVILITLFNLSLYSCVSRLHQTQPQQIPGRWTSACLHLPTCITF